MKMVLYTTTDIPPLKQKKHSHLEYFTVSAKCESELSSTVAFE